ncbi:T9SS type A sorting domain-containing protein [Constantimarinum furrinae]|uniref:Secretion system C-terminal sorting domain-containing protein n=1 Tax=Constantimarinum furrinae TaxID=2562285 RepID=A0A7G8PWM2_9FLAO|nr:T9SS type A sorting domain-containing protein [Constantimarinum furrinae]QNJ98738.1 hypothetical protein ALE3EI_2193 [Constantimarinum furrinae]
MTLSVKLKSVPVLRFVGIILLYSYPTNAQFYSSQQLKAMHSEIPDDEYIIIDKSLQARSPAYRVFSSNFFTAQVNVDSNGNNIVGDAANEPSIAVDPTNPDRIVIGWRQFDSVGNNFRQAGYGYSLDGGLSWTFPGVLDPGNFRSDPVLDFDKDGNFYYNSLQGSFACDVFKITNGGVVWDAPVSARGGDKQWMRIDRSNQASAGFNYSYWNESFTTCAGDFTRSVDGSNTFESCVSVLGDPFWGTLAVDNDGVLYITGTSPSGIIVIRSSTAQYPTNPVTFDSFATVDLDGNLDAGIPVNPQGLLGQAWVDVDKSGGPGDGNLYVLASVQRNNGDPADVMFARSTDGGNSFEPPVRLNDDANTTAFQWFGTMSVAPNGRIDVAWLDTRDAPGGTVDSVLYYTFSIDNGDSWEINEPISLAFDPTIGYPQQNKMGDYFDMVSDNDAAHLTWTNTLNGGQDVYYTRIEPFPLGVESFIADFGVTAYPNPFSDSITIEFNLPVNDEYLVEVFDMLGRKVNTLLKGCASGKQKWVWTGTNDTGRKLNSGLYFISIKTNTSTEVIKVILQ